MTNLDGPLVGALVAGAVLLVVGVGSVFVAPSGVEVVDGAVPHDVPVPRPLPVEPPAPPGGGLQDELLAIDQEVLAFREQIRLAIEEGRADDQMLRELYVENWHLNSIRDELRLELAAAGRAVSFLDEARAGLTSVDVETVERLRGWLAAPDAVQAAQVFGPVVELGLGWDLLARLEPSERVERERWTIGDDSTAFAASTGPYDVWATVETALGGDHELLVGEAPHCASAPKPTPVQLDHLRRINIVTVDEEIGCLTWSMVSLFVADDSRIHAVTLDRWEP